MDPGDADWWWQYGLDGVIGGLIGALVTGVVTAWITVRGVRLTLDHERALQREAQRDVHVAELRVSVIQLQAACLGFLLPETSRRGKPRDDVPPSEFRGLFVQTLETESLARGPAPQLAKDLAEFRNRGVEKVASGAPQSEVARTVRVLLVVLKAWLRDPQDFEAHHEVAWDEIAEVTENPPPDSAGRPADPP